MPTYRIIQKGWETYTGDIGQVLFKDGLTIEDYPEVYIDRVAASFAMVDIETGDPAGLAHRMIATPALRMPVADKLDQMSAEQIAIADAAAVADAARTLRPTSFLTLEQLEAVVDAKGIQGLREIALPYGVKAKSINDLMGAILKAQDVVRSARGVPAAPSDAPNDVVETETPAPADEPPADVPPVPTDVAADEEKAA